MSIENRRVLLIDDTQSIHEDYQKILCPDQFEKANDRFSNLKAQILQQAPVTNIQQAFILDSAYQGQAGLERVKSQLQLGQPYAVAFVDMRMPPGWDGLETVEHLWKVDSDLQIVICSAYSDYDWSQLIERVGMNGNLVILKKPFDKEEVLQLAVALSKKWELTRQTQLTLESLEEKVKERTQALTLANTKLTEEMRIREQINTELRLAQKLESIGQLAAGIAHEINTPIQFIGDNVRFMQEAFESISESFSQIKHETASYSQDELTGNRLDKVAAYVQNQDLDYFVEELPQAIQDTLVGVERITEIVQAMKSFSHPGSKDLQPTDINALIQTTVKVSTHEWKYFADIDLQLSPDLPTIDCHPNELSQALLNMIVNAVHAIENVVGSTGNKGRITVSTNMGAEGIEIAISDTGSGMSSDVQAKIFDPFFTTKEVGKGTGQGLAIAHSVITQKMSGRLEVSSQEGEGTTFYLKLPVKQEVEPSRSAKEKT